MSDFQIGDKLKCSCDHYSCGIKYFSDDIYAIYQGKCMCAPGCKALIVDLYTNEHIQIEDEYPLSDKYFTLFIPAPKVKKVHKLTTIFLH